MLGWKPLLILRGDHFCLTQIFCGVSFFWSSLWVHLNVQRKKYRLIHWHLQIISYFYDLTRWKTTSYIASFECSIFCVAPRWGGREKKNGKWYSNGAGCECFACFLHRALLLCSVSCQLAEPSLGAVDDFYKSILITISGSKVAWLRVTENWVNKSLMLGEINYFTFFSAPTTCIDYYCLLYLPKEWTLQTAKPSFSYPCYKAGTDLVPKFLPNSKGFCNLPKNQIP